jgi:hypothetical protein
VAKELRATRYLTAANDGLARFIVEDLPYLDFDETLDFYADSENWIDDNGRALLNANDRYYLFTVTCKRHDAWHPWLFERCREVEAQPDGFLDLWARYHYKSSIGTFAGIIQEIIVDPEITVAIISGTNAVARPFLQQIQEELETNEDLQRIHSDVFWSEPRKEAPLWSREKGLKLKRRGNPKEATIEAFGLIDGARTGRHFALLVYDDLIDETMVGTPEMIQKVTQKWELSDNLGQMKGTRKWHFGTRYSYADTYGVILDRGVLKERRYPATENGALNGKPIMLTQERWDEVRKTQKSTVAAQMLLNPLAGSENSFSMSSIKQYDVIPSVLNVYIMIDPSKGRGPRSDRTAIIVIGIDVAGNKYLLDGFAHRMRLSERYQKMKQLEAKWHDHPGVQLVRVGYEQYGMQSDLETIEENMQRDGIWISIEEMNSSKDGSGKNAKPDRISRLEPDMNRGAFYVPSVVYHPDFGGSHNNSSLWNVWTEEDHERAEQAGMQKNPAVDTIIYRPMQGPTRRQRYMEVTEQKYRIVVPIKRVDEQGNAYDLTRMFLEEMRLHPFAPHDDILDSASRIYDLEPKAPVAIEAMASTEPTAHPDT